MPAYPDAYLLLAEIYEKQGEKAKGTDVYQRALAVEGLSPKAREYIKAQLAKAQGPADVGPRLPKKQ
jgi:predicted Zn-dependent protease